MDEEIEANLFFGKFFLKLTNGVKLMIFMSTKDSTMRADLGFVSHTDDVQRLVVDGANLLFLFFQGTTLQKEIVLQILKTVVRGEAS